MLVKVRKANEVYRVDEQKLQEYLQKGFVKVEAKKVLAKPEKKEEKPKVEEKITPKNKPEKKEEK